MWASVGCPIATKSIQDSTNRSLKAYADPKSWLVSLALACGSARAVNRLEILHKALLIVCPCPQRNAREKTLPWPGLRRRLRRGDKIEDYSARKFLVAVINI